MQSIGQETDARERQRVPPAGETDLHHTRFGEPHQFEGATELFGQRLPIIQEWITQNQRKTGTFELAKANRA